MNKIKYILINLVAIILFSLDIYLKKIFSASFGREYFIFSDWIKLVYAYNPGVAFGIHVDYYFILIFYIIAIPILIRFLFLQYKKNNVINVAAVTLVLFGALSNLLDRIFLGGVVDYLNIKYWGILNIADALIVVGVTIMIFVSLKDRK